MQLSVFPLGQTLYQNMQLFFGGKRDCPVISTHFLRPVEINLYVLKVIQKIEYYLITMKEAADKHQMGDI